MLTPIKSPPQSHYTGGPEMANDSNEFAISETFSDSTLLEFFETEMNGNSKYANELIYVLTKDTFILSANGVDTTTHYEKLQPFLKSEESRTAALKIAYYVLGNLAEKTGSNSETNAPSFYFKKAAELGFMPALKPLSDCYLRGEATGYYEPSYLALEILNAASISNTEAPAQTDNAEINALLQSLFEAKDCRATYQLARLNAQMGNKEEATDLLHTSALIEKHPDAMTELGRLHFKGSIFYEIKKDQDFGEFVLTGAATEFNSVTAHQILRDIYLRGEGKNAVSYFSKGQANQDPQAIMDLSTLYEKGLGVVNKDIIKAHEILLSGSDAGLADVTFALANLHLRNSKVSLYSFRSMDNFQKQDAYPFLVKAADQGHSQAAWEVGLAHLNYVKNGKCSSDEEKSENMAVAENYIAIAKNGGYEFADNAVRMLQRIKKGL